MSAKTHRTRGSKKVASRRSTKHMTTSSRSSQKQTGKTAVVVLVLVLAAVVSVVVYLVMQMSGMRGSRTDGSVELAPPMGGLAGLFGRKAVKPTMAPEAQVMAVPTMVPRPLPKGQQDFVMSLSDEYTGPKPTEIIVSEFTEVKNEPETVKVMINKATPATAIKGVVSTDSKEVPFTLTLQSESGTDQVWVGNWTLTDTVTKNYVLKFTATGASGTSEFAVAAR
jgi:hypothetical protein